MPAAPNMIRFAGASGALLAARLDLPPGTPSTIALFAHCFTCSKESLAATRIAAALVAYGIGVLRFDFTGLGGSEGEFANTNFSSNAADLVAAAAWLRANRAAPVLLIGHSLGGAAVLAAASQIQESVAIATVGAPFDPAHVRHLLAPAVAEIEQAGEAAVSLAGRSFRFRKQFLDDLATQNRAHRPARRRATPAPAGDRQPLPRAPHAPFGGLDSDSAGRDSSGDLTPTDRHQHGVSPSWHEHLLSQSA